jgi:hypothetical protein
MTEIITRERDPAAYDALIAANVDPRMARIYAARGIGSPADLNHEFNALLPPSQLHRINEAATLLADAILASKRLLIIADYDSLLHNLRNHLVQYSPYHSDNTDLFSENSSASYLANTRWTFPSSAAQASEGCGNVALL